MIAIATQILTWCLGSIKKSPRAWLLGAIAVGLAIAFVVIRHAGVVAGRREVEDADRRRVLERVHEQIVLADAVADSTSHEEAAAAAAEQAAKSKGAVARQQHATARARVTITSDTTVAVDRGPTIVVTGPVVDVIRRADAVIVRDSVTAAAADTLQAKTAANRDAIATQRDLERERADTLSARDPSAEGATSRCGATCKTAIAVTTVAAVAGVVIRFVLHARASRTP